MTHHAPNEVKIAAFYHEKEKTMGLDEVASSRMG